MPSVAIIVFRESLEIALILGVVIAATRGLHGRNLWTALGMAGGVAGSAIVALFAGTLNRMAEGMGQEIFNALILFAATTLIGFTAVWMRSHARQQVQHIKEVGTGVREGKLPLYALSTVIMLAVWREGSEIVLFLYSMAIGGETTMHLAAGSLAGFAGGILVGTMMYRGLLKMAARRMFQLTSWLLIMLAAGMASEGAKLLAEAGVFTHYITPLWNTAALLPEKSILGQILHALVGYTAQPMGIQLVFYAATFFLLVGGMKFIERDMRVPAVSVVSVAALVLVALQPGKAHALDGKVYSPNVVKGETELEYAGTRTFDNDPSRNNSQEHEFSIGYGVTDFWAPEIYFATLERGPGEPMDFTAVEFENRFQFWPSGKYWLDAGMIVSYISAAKHDDADALELKLLLQKDFSRFTSIVNLGMERQVGSHATAGNDLSSVANVRYRWIPQFEPGIEMQNDYGKRGEHLSFNEQAHYLGPVAYGKVLPQTLPGLKYEAAYYIGLTGSSSTSAARFKLEYEFPL